MILKFNMQDNFLTQNIIIQLILKQKILMILITLIVFMGILIIYITSSEKDNKQQNQFLNQNILKPTANITISTPITKQHAPIIPTPSKASPRLNLITFFSSLFGVAPKKTKQTNPTLPPTQPDLTIALMNQPTLINGTQGVQNSLPTNGGYSTQPTTSTQNTPQQAINNNTSETNIQIIFQSPDGQTETYVPPSTPPIEVTWLKYINEQDHFTIDYPANFQIVKQQINSHESVSLYQPNADISDPNQAYISFGLSIYKLYPENGIKTDYIATPIKVTNIPGTVYTHGPIGISYIISIFPYLGGHFGLASATSGTELNYIYNHMLNSLVFKPQ